MPASLGYFRVGIPEICVYSYHLLSPIRGQGMNTGIQDALTSGCKLAYVIQYRVPKQALLSYSNERTGTQ